MEWIETAARTAGRARYAAAQGLRAAWYGAQYAGARRRSAGFDRPGEPPFRPSRKPDLRALRAAWLKMFQDDRANIEAGLYPAPEDFRLRDLPGALRSAARFQADAPSVDKRRVRRNGVEVRAEADLEKYPAYYRQNFHYQTGGWLSDDSAALYDTQVETLFTGAADAMRRAALAEIARELKGRDQRRARLLDLACGTGRFLAETLRAFPRLQASGLDLSPNYAAKARAAVAAWPHVEVVEGLAEEPPFEDAEFDIVVSIYLFHELPPRLRARVIRQVARLLKPGGVFIFADSLQFGDAPALDGVLEYFPEGFHEPYFKNYLSYDFAPDMEQAGLAFVRAKLAFLTKVSVWRKS